MRRFSASSYKRFMINDLNDLHYRIITAEAPSSVASEAFRRAKVSLEYATKDKELQVIQITSSSQSEGKTTAILNLAMTYVEDGKKVLCLDLDLRRPKLHHALKIKNERGLTDYLAGKIELNEAIKLSRFGFDVLNSGKKASYPTSLLNSKVLDDLMLELRKRYDIILVDSAPVLSVSDPIVISRLTDGCIFLVNQQLTKKAIARDAVVTLKNNKVNVLGVIFTGITESSSYGYGYYSYKYKYYYYDGYNHKHHKK